jgi:dTDP-4-amino-4,6-dideoxygalactose transaminase
MDNMINVTKTFLPPLEEYINQIRRIYDNNVLTNRGVLVRELEEKLKAYLSIDDILITNNGTVPLQIALKLLGKGGEVITTPFSYVATTAAIVWENCTPVFVDIHPDYLTIDETKIEEKITERTTCILATHVFGNPCNVEAIETIARKHGLYVIYDAAHAFGVTYKGKSLFDYGDISTCSFHATKLFHTGEGGSIVTKDAELRHKVYYSHNFGHNGPADFFGLGINAKISELQAAMGLAVFPYLTEILASRKAACDLYDESIDFERIRKIRLMTDTEWNYSYYPVIFNSEASLLTTVRELNALNINPRRYFYPALNQLPFVPKFQMPNSDQISKSVLCLPLYSGIGEEVVEIISNVINTNQKP